MATGQIALLDAVHGLLTVVCAKFDAYVRSCTASAVAATHSASDTWLSPWTAALGSASSSSSQRHPTTAGNRRGCTHDGRGK